MDKRTATASGLMKTWKPLTRGGYEKIIYAVYPDQKRGIHGAIKQADGIWHSRCWYQDGRASISMTTDDDLLPENQPKKMLRVWMNVYDGGRRVFAQDNKRSADDVAGPDRIACLYIEREYTEGEGL